MISACILIDSAQLWTVARRSPSSARGGAVTSAHSTIRPRVTTCSMSTTSTEYAARVSKRPAVMPGLSFPKILTRRVGTSGDEVCEALMVFPPYPAPSASAPGVRLTDTEHSVSGGWRDPYIRDTAWLRRGGGAGGRGGGLGRWAGAVPPG